MAKILLVTKEGCLPCLRVKRILREIRSEIPGVFVEEVDFTSEQGMKLAFEYQILYPPAVFINGELFGKGKIYEEELKQAIRSSATPKIG